MIKIDDKQLDELTAEFITRLEIPTNKLVKPYVLGIIGQIGSGKTTVARKLAALLNGVVVVSANSARYLLKDAGLSWGDNVREIVKQVGMKLLEKDYAVILDGSTADDDDRRNITEMVKLSGVPVFYVRINISHDACREREAAKYDNVFWQSSFDDFRVNTTEKMLANIDDRRAVHDKFSSADVLGLIAELDNNGTLVELDRQLQGIVQKIKHGYDTPRNID